MSQTMNDAARLDKITTAIARNNLAGFRKLVTPENASWRDEDGVTLAVNVVLDEDADPEMLRHLIQCGADIEFADGRKYTALHFAARDQRLEMTEVLLEAGAEVDAVDSDGMTPLAHCALRLNPSLALAALLLGHSADPNKRSKHEGSPLQIARRGEDHELIALFRTAQPAPKRAGVKSTKKASIRKRAVKRPQTKKAARSAPKKR
jgi:ankyrin repeat protein